MKIKSRGAEIRCRTNFTLSGEKPTKYFLNLEKQRAVSKTIQRLEMEDGRMLTVGKEILEEIRTFYQKLYTSSGPIDKSYVDKLEIPRLPDEVKNELEEEIMVEELGLALKNM